MPRGRVLWAGDEAWDKMVRQIILKSLLKGQDMRQETNSRQVGVQNMPSLWAVYGIKVELFLDLSTRSVQNTSHLSKARVTCPNE